MAAYSQVPRFEGDESETKIYPYRSSAASFAAVAGLSGLAGAGLGFTACHTLHDHRPLFLIIIVLPPEIAYLVWRLLSFALYAAALYVAYQGVRAHITHPSFISLSATSITLPPCMFSSEVDHVPIEYASVRRLEVARRFEATRRPEQVSLSEFDANDSSSQHPSSNSAPSSAHHRDLSSYLERPKSLCIYFRTEQGTEQKAGPIHPECLPLGGLPELISALQERSPALQVAEEV